MIRLTSLQYVTDKRFGLFAGAVCGRLTFPIRQPTASAVAIDTAFPASVRVAPNRSATTIPSSRTNGKGFDSGSHVIRMQIVILLDRRAAGRQPSASRRYKRFVSRIPLVMTQIPGHDVICYRRRGSKELTRRTDAQPLPQPRSQTETIR